MRGWGFGMNQPEASWKWNPNTAQWSAILIDAQGIEWEARIEKAGFSFLGHQTFIAVLLARKTGTYYSNSTFSTVEEAQSWCYLKISILDDHSC